MKMIILMVVIGFLGCSEPATVKQSPKKVIKLDMIQKDGKFISPRQLRAVTGDEDA